MHKRHSIQTIARLTDIELCTQLRGDRDTAETAFKELYRRYASRIHAYCYKILANKEEAEDVFQETFVRFYSGAQAAHEMTNVSGYLFRIARNLSLNRIRARTDITSLDGVDLAGTPDHTLENSELLSLIAGAVELLDLEFREAFVLREYENMPYEEIATLLDISVANAKSRVFRARQKIKKLLAPNIRELD